MDFLSKEQILAIVVFFAGGGVLSLCSKLESDRREIRKDPKYRAQRMKENKPDREEERTGQGTALTVIGFGLIAWSFYLFWQGVK